MAVSGEPAAVGDVDDAPAAPLLLMLIQAANALLDVNVAARISDRQPLVPRVA